jgi:hypothetical protein
VEKIVSSGGNTEKEQGSKAAIIKITRSAAPTSSTFPYPLDPTNAAEALANQYTHAAGIESPGVACSLLATAFGPQQQGEDPSRARL